MADSATAEKKGRTQHGWAWVALCLAFGLHVLDEAFTDFLSVYNPVVRGLRERYPFLPLPTFRFEVWLALLATAVVVLLLLSPFVFRGARWMIPVSYGFAVVMLANGVAHLLISFSWGRPMPGAYSSPVLLVASAWLLVCACQQQGSVGRATSGSGE